MKKEVQRHKGAKAQGRITKNQDTRIQIITNTGCRKVGEYKGMRGGEHKQRSIPKGPDFVKISLDSTMNHPALHSRLRQDYGERDGGRKEKSEVLREKG